MAGFTLHPERFDRERTFGVLCVAAVYVALAAVYLLTHTSIIIDRYDPTLATFDVTAVKPAPPPPPEELKRRAPLREGRASPANLKSRATPVVAPPPEVVTFIPPPLPAAPIPAIGNDLSSGNSDRPGPGTGSGGTGEGTGSGGDGNGPGGGGGGTHVRLLQRIKDERACGDRFGSLCPTGDVGIRFLVNQKGRATHCSVIASSGNPNLDADTCRMIEKSLRYRPATDRSGKKIAEWVSGVQEWRLREWLPQGEQR